ncbi:MAG: hypothetical protein KAH30_03030 [Caldisericia bacterium]|nr:hypothetical protein [Caldisericia bacterium]
MELYEKGLDKYPISSVVISNLLMLIWIEIGAFAIYMFHPVGGIVYTFLAVFMVYIFLRWAVCRHCYYYGRRCATGWGLISSTLFSKGDESKFTAKITQASIAVTYLLILIPPIVILIVLMVKSFVMIYLYTLIVFLVAGFLSSFVFRARSCAKCKLRISCPGCAAPLK